jgi:hypothetical protein
MWWRAAFTASMMASKVAAPPTSSRRSVAVLTGKSLVAATSRATWCRRSELPGMRSRRRCTPERTREVLRARNRLMRWRLSRCGPKK